jgi:ATP-binding cassette subfamily F protein uup
MLARALARPSNLLVLDEPTNDLDLETLDLLQEMLADYKGAVMLVSHDRDFIDRIVTSVIAFEGDGHWVEYAGGYSDIAAQQSGDGAEEMKAKGRAGKSSLASLSRKSKAKLSFKETHALKSLPEVMARLQGEIDGYQHTLADADLYARDRQAFDDAAAALATKAQDFAAMEEEWLALEIKREEIEGG